MARGKLGPESRANVAAGKRKSWARLHALAEAGEWVLTQFADVTDEEAAEFGVAIRDTLRDVDMTELNEHEAASAQARALREHARRARNALQGQSAESANPNAVPADQTEHEPMTGVHSHLHAAHGADDEDNAGYHYHDHVHRGDNVHSPRRQPDHDTTPRHHGY